MVDFKLVIICLQKEPPQVGLVKKLTGSSEIVFCYETKARKVMVDFKLGMSS